MYSQIVNIIKKIIGKGPHALHEPYFFGNEWKYVKKTIDDNYVSSIGSFVNKFENQIPKDKKFIILNNSFREFVKIVKSKSNKILLIADNPRLLETEFCLRSNLIDYRKIKFNSDFCAISKESYLYQNNMITKIYEENLNLLNLSYVSPNQIYKLFCEEYCSIKKNEKFLYVIRDHLNDNSSKILMEYILNNFKINYEYNKL